MPTRKIIAGKRCAIESSGKICHVRCASHESAKSDFGSEGCSWLFSQKRMAGRFSRHGSLNGSLLSKRIILRMIASGVVLGMRWTWASQKAARK